MNTPRLLIVAAVLLAALAGGARSQTYPARERMRLALDIARFRGGDDSTSLVELHYSINRDALTFLRDSAGWGAAADMLLTGKSGDSLVLADRWLVPARLADTAGAKSGMNLVGVYPVQFRRGVYDIRLVARDRGAAGNRDSISVRVPVTPPPADRPVMSDIEFAASIKPGAKESPFT